MNLHKVDSFKEFGLSCKYGRPRTETKKKFKESISITGTYTSPVSIRKGTGHLNMIERTPKTVFMNGHLPSSKSVSINWGHVGLYLVFKELSKFSLEFRHCFSS